MTPLLLLFQEFLLWVTATEEQVRSLGTQDILVISPRKSVSFLLELGSIDGSAKSSVE